MAHTQGSSLVRSTIETVVPAHLALFTETVYSFLVIQEFIYVGRGLGILLGLEGQCSDRTGEDRII